jgi:hypothetical protein
MPSPGQYAIRTRLLAGMLDGARMSQLSAIGCQSNARSADQPSPFEELPGSLLSLPFATLSKSSTKESWPESFSKRSTNLSQMPPI